MIAPIRTEKQTHETSELQANFVALLPAITRRANFALRRWRDEARADLVQEIVANCFVAYHRLAQRGKADLAFPTALVRYALRHVLAGRRAGGKSNVSDVMSHQVQRTRDLTVERLEPVR